MVRVIYPIDYCTLSQWIFLAGPIRGAPLWRDEAISILSGIDSDKVIVSPQKGSLLRSDFGEKVCTEWERYHLHNAEVVLFYLPRALEDIPGRGYAQSTRFELGEMKAYHEILGKKVVIGVENGFYDANYIIQRFKDDCPSVPVCSSLEETCQNAISLINIS